MADKFEQEIEEIIRKSGGDLPPSPRAARRSVRKAKETKGRWRPPLNAGYLMLGSIGLLLVGVLLWGTSSGLGGMTMLGSVILFLFSYLLFFGKRATSGGYEKRWRGQPIIDRPPPPVSDRLRDWWRRTRHRN
tara:strand:+ start:57 stop:455 length:399 start_codon:yes stop_codon:yes gene_type:complete